jgi:tetratricopeptide (TPR) repeat protein
LFKMQDLMTADLAANLHARTEGNALLLTQAVDAFKHTEAPLRLLKHLFETDDIERFLVEQIDDSLTENERAVMCAVAVLQGHAGTRDAIEAIVDGENVRRTLGGLRKRYLLHVTEGEAGREYSMNAIVRYFYYDLLGKRERQEMHRRAGEYYETEEPDVLKAARHFQEAREYERAAQLATQHVRALINQGQARPLHVLLERFTAQQVGRVLWARVNLALGQVVALFGDRTRAQACYEETHTTLATLPDSTDVRDLRASACRWLAELHHQHGAYDQALEQIQEGLATLEGREPAEVAALTLLAAHVYIRQGDYDGALAQAQDALRLAQEPSPPILLARAHNVLGRIASRRGANATAIEHFQESLGLYRRVSDLIGQAKSHNLIGTAHFEMGHWSEAEAELEQARELFDQLGDVHYCAILDNNLGTMALNRGRLDEAVAY